MKKILKVWLLAFLLAFAPLNAEAAQDVQISYSGTSVPIVTNVPFSVFSSGGSSVNNNYYFVVTPQSAMTLFVSNFAASNPHSITIKTAITGSATVAGPLSAPTQWTPLTTTLVNDGTGAAGASATIQTLNVGAGKTAIIGSGILSAAKVSINVSGGDNSSDLVSIYAVLTPNGILPGTQVTGTQAQNTNGSTVNPVLMGGLDGNSGGTIHTLLVGGCDITGVGECMRLATSTFSMAQYLNNGMAGLQSLAGYTGSIYLSPLAVQQVDANTKYFNNCVAGICSTGSFQLASPQNSRVDLYSVTVNTAGDATAGVTVYENSGGSCAAGVEVAGIDGSQPSPTLDYHVQIPSGACVVISGVTAPDVTVIYTF